MNPSNDGQTSRYGAITRLIQKVKAGEAGSEDKLIKTVSDRLIALVRKMLNQSPRIRRWRQTDDLFNDLWLKLRQVVRGEPINDSRHFFRIANLQMNRMLCDLARKFSGPESFEGRHQTGSFALDSVGEDVRHGPAHEEPVGLARRNRPTPSQFLGPRQPGPPTAVALKDDHFLVHRLISLLPDEDAELIGLIYYQEFTQQEAGALLGVDESTIRRRLRRIEREMGQLRKGRNNRQQNDEG